MGAQVEGTCRAHSRRVIIVFAECADLCGSDIHRTALQLCCCWWRPTHPRTHICAMCTHELVAVVCVCKVPVFACFGPCALLFLRCAAAQKQQQEHTRTHCVSRRSAPLWVSRISPCVEMEWQQTQRVAVIHRIYFLLPCAFYVFVSQ